MITWAPHTAVIPADRLWTLAWRRRPGLLHVFSGGHDASHAARTTRRGHLEVEEQGVVVGSGLDTLWLLLEALVLHRHLEGGQRYGGQQLLRRQRGGRGVAVHRVDKRWDRCDVRGPHGMRCTHDGSTLTGRWPRPACPGPCGPCAARSASGAAPPAALRRVMLGHVNTVNSGAPFHCCSNFAIRAASGCT